MSSVLLARAVEGVGTVQGPLASAPAPACLTSGRHATGL